MEQFPLLLVFVLLGGGELCKCFQVGVLDGLRHLALYVDPLSFDLGLVEVPHRQNSHLLLE